MQTISPLYPSANEYSIISLQVLCHYTPRFAMLALLVFLRIFCPSGPTSDTCYSDHGRQSQHRLRYELVAGMGRAMATGLAFKTASNQTISLTRIDLSGNQDLWTRGKKGIAHAQKIKSTKIGVIGHNFFYAVAQ